MEPSCRGFRRLRNSCDMCTLSKLKCTREKPVCQRCIDRGCQQECKYSIARRPGRRRQKSVVLGDNGSRSPDPGVDELRVEQTTAPPTRASSFTDSLLLIEKRHDLTGNTAGGGKDRHMMTRSSEMSLTELLVNMSTELAQSDDVIDFEAIDDFPIWNWGENGLDTDFTNSHYAGSVAQIWDIPTGQTMLNDTELGISDNAEELRNASALPGSHASGQNLLPNNRNFLTPTSELAKDAGSSSPATSNLIFDLPKDVDCKCSSRISHLAYLISLQRASPTPVDFVFAVEQQLNQTKDIISTCQVCSLSSPYTRMLLCTSMSWVIEHLEIYIREASTDVGQVPDLTIDGLKLSKEMSHSCFEALVKLRLRRMVQTARELAGLNMETKSTLLNSLQSAASETGAVAQQLFGMLQMRCAF